MSEEKKKCPFCKGEIPAEATQCVHCKRELPSTVPPPKKKASRFSTIGSNLGAIGILGLMIGGFFSIPMIVFLLTGMTGGIFGVLSFRKMTPEEKQIPFWKDGTKSRTYAALFLGGWALILTILVFCGVEL